MQARKGVLAFRETLQLFESIQQVSVVIDFSVIFHYQNLYCLDCYYLSDTG